ncbi:MAG: nucleoside hydrolase, partial [Gemmatimonadales bacterium]
MTMQIIIDTDPGIDDLVALALAARSPELSIVAVTATYGNATLAQTTHNTRELLRRVGKPLIPVLPGSDRPLDRDLVTAPEIHGPRGVGFAPVKLADPVTSNPAALADLLRTTSEPVTLVTLGPLTNLAHAVLIDRTTVRSKITRHVGMFGTIAVRARAGRMADFNSWCDPEAVSIVLDAEIPTLMVGLEASNRMLISGEEVRGLGSSTDDLTNWLAQALQFYVEVHRKRDGIDGCRLPDVLPLGELIHSGLLDCDTRCLEVVSEDGEQRGRTVATDTGVAVAVAMDADTDTMKALLARVFDAGWNQEDGDTD